MNKVGVARLSVLSNTALVIFANCRGSILILSVSFPAIHSDLTMAAADELCLVKRAANPGR